MTNSERLRYLLCALYPRDTISGSREFHVSAAMRTFCKEVSSVKGRKWRTLLNCLHFNSLAAVGAKSIGFPVFDVILRLSQAVGRSIYQEESFSIAARRDLTEKSRIEHQGCRISLVQTSLILLTHQEAGRARARRLMLLANRGVSLRWWSPEAAWRAAAACFRVIPCLSMKVRNPRVVNASTLSVYAQ